jgi:hypothetical protein
VPPDADDPGGASGGSFFDITPPPVAAPDCGLGDTPRTHSFNCPAFFM